MSSFFEELQEDKEAAHSYFKAGNMQILARPSAKEKKKVLVFSACYTSSILYMLVLDCFGPCVCVAKCWVSGAPFASSPLVTSAVLD